jgi:Transposase
MSDVSKEQPLITAGLDIGDKYSYLCLIDQRSGEVIEEGRLRTTPETLRRRFASEPSLRVAIEAGTHSPWVSRVLEECDHEVLVANARKLRLIYANKRKTDEIDAENLARLARLDPKLLYPLKHRGEDSQAHMAIIRSRQVLVGRRTQLVNPGFEERSSPSEEGCPSARPGASTRTRPSTSPRHSGRLLGPSWSRDRLDDGAHPRLREAAGEDLQGALSRNRSLASGRGSRDAYGADLRAHPGRPLPLRKEPQRGCLSGTCACQRSVGRQGSPETHLQGR